MAGLWRYRRFIWETALSDLRYRYAGSGLGVFWNVLTPLAMLGLYTFIFGNALAQRVSPSASTSAPFVFYLASGFLPWGAFADGIGRGTNALVGNGAYLKKMAFPEQVFVAQAAVSAVLGMFIVIGLLIGLAFALGRPPQLSWLILPFIVVLWQGLGFGLGLGLATLNVFFRDVAQIVSVLLQIWMWSLPIVYFEDLLPAAYRQTLEFNPAYPFVRAFRDAYLGTVTNDMVWTLAAMLGWAVLAIVTGSRVMIALRSEIRDML